MNPLESPYENGYRDEFRSVGTRTSERLPLAIQKYSEKREVIGDIVSHMLDQLARGRHSDELVKRNLTVSGTEHFVWWANRRDVYRQYGSDTPTGLGLTTEGVIIVERLAGTLNGGFSFRKIILPPFTSPTPDAWTKIGDAYQIAGFLCSKGVLELFRLTEVAQQRRWTSIHSERSITSGWSPDRVSSLA